MGSQVTVFMWEQREAGSGPRNVMSALKLYFDKWANGRKTLNLWCDNTWKGTKNWQWMWFFAYLTTDAFGKPKYFETANLRFFVKGHTFMTGTGPDACHNMFKQAKPKNKDMITIDDWLSVARTVDGGSWEVVHLKTEMHFDWFKYLHLAYRKPPPKSRQYILNQFHWFHSDSGVVDARSRHHPEARATRLLIDKPKWGAFNPATFVWPDIQESRFAMTPEPLSLSTCAGIINSMVMMSIDAAATWKRLLVDQLGEAEYNAEAYKIELAACDSGFSSDTGDDSDNREQRWLDRKSKRAAVRTKFGVRPPGYREDYDGDKVVAPVNIVSKARRQRKKDKKEERKESTLRRAARN